MIAAVLFSSPPISEHCCQDPLRILTAASSFHNMSYLFTYPVKRYEIKKGELRSRFPELEHIDGTDALVVAINLFMFFCKAFSVMDLSLQVRRLCCHFRNQTHPSSGGWGQSMPRQSNNSSRSQYYYLTNNSAQTNRIFALGNPRLEHKSVAAMVSSESLHTPSLDHDKMESST